MGPFPFFYCSCPMCGQWTNPAVPHLDVTSQNLCLLFCFIYGSWLGKYTHIYLILNMTQALVLSQFRDSVQVVAATHCTWVWPHGLFWAKIVYFFNLKAMESLKYFFLVFLTSCYSFFHCHLLNYILIILSLYYSNSFLATLHFTFSLIDLFLSARFLFCRIHLSLYYSLPSSTITTTNSKNLKE